ncbi:DedA family protein [Streptomyces sp. NPDC090442]|uniref:DedA family protein n=1 Tax=Streptomyces sp. NPDC090442 TaxID=3365962 RepID=UPI003809F0AA
MRRIGGWLRGICLRHASGRLRVTARAVVGRFGLFGVLVVVFLESGIPVGFFLPGDSLLFAVGLLVTTGELDEPLWLVCAAVVVVAAVLGDQAGYVLGRRAGASLAERPGSRLVRRGHIDSTRRFFERHGPKALILARFVPLARTFTPIVAGASRMNYRTFLTYNIVGGVLWGAGLILLGAGLGTIVFVRENIEPIIIAIVVIATLPVIVELLRARLGKR